MMKSLEAAGEEFLDLTERLLSAGQDSALEAVDTKDFSRIADHYETASVNASLQRDDRLKEAADYLYAETLRLSATRSSHPLFHQVTSNQRFARQRFAAEIERLVGRN